MTVFFLTQFLYMKTEIDLNTNTNASLDSVIKKLIETSKKHLKNRHQFHLPLIIQFNFIIMNKREFLIRNGSVLVAVMRFHHLETTSLMKIAGTPVLAVSPRFWRYYGLCEYLCSPIYLSRSRKIRSRIRIYLSKSCVDLWNRWPIKSCTFYG